MIVERRANHGMPNGGCSGNQDSTSARCVQGDKSPGAASNHEDDSHEAKTQREQKNKPPRPDVNKSGVVNSSAAEKTSPKVGKPSFNPITHVSSRSLCPPVVFCTYFNFIQLIKDRSGKE